MELEMEKDSIQAMNAVLRNAPIADENVGTAAQSKRNSKPKRKDSNFNNGNEIAEILKSTQSSDEKLSVVCNKYSEQVHANRKLMMAYKMAEGRIAKMQQENEQCQQGRLKAVLARSRLENLCRELQKLNKAQKEEIDLKLRLEEEKRKEISATFQNAFAEMNTLTSQNTEKHTKMREENLEMREKIKSVRERIELSEQQLDKVRQQAQLELQLAEAKMAKIKLEMTAEKECLLKEKQQLLLTLTEYQVRISELQATEVGLRSQISMYTEKYDDFQNALTKSNKVFSGFNEEMAKMSKKITKLEKETTLWKQKWEKSNDALLNMAADKQTRDAEMGKLNHKLSLLQELCKAFQRERTELLAQLRAATHGNELSDEHAKMDQVNIKQVEELSKNCQDLKDNLVQLQGSLAESIFESNIEQASSQTEKKADKNLNNEIKATKILDNSNDASSKNIDEEKETLTQNTKDIASTNAVDDKSTIEVSEKIDQLSGISENDNTVKTTADDNKTEESKSDTNVVIESIKNEVDGSACASLEVIDRSTLEENKPASSKQVDLVPASSTCDSLDKKTDKVDEVKTALKDSTANSNGQKEIETTNPSEATGEKKDATKLGSTKKTKDGKRRKK